MSERVFFKSRIGDVKQIYDEVPDGWHQCDGSTLETAEWPEFAAAMKLTDVRFVLPKPERTPAGSIFIIKMRSKTGSKTDL